MKPCGHADNHREPGCRVCELYATDERYRRLWDGGSVPSGVCRFRGESLTGYERHRLGLSSSDWAPCNHPDRPKGEYVCPCSGCNAACPGHKTIPTED